MALSPCRECEQVVSTGAPACPHCGTPNPTGPTCSSCGNPIQPRVAACPKCWTPVSAEVPMASSNAVPRTLAAILGTLFGIYAIWWAVTFRGVGPGPRWYCQWLS